VRELRAIVKNSIEMLPIAAADEVLDEGVIPGFPSAKVFRL
jgi:hypothetical protein